MTQFEGPIATLPGAAEFNPQAVTASVGDRSHGTCALFDFSKHPRFGLRGVGATEFLRRQKIPLPEAINQVELTAKGEAVLRLGKTETWVLAAPTPSVYFGHWQQKLTQEQAADLYPLYLTHSHAWLVLIGPARAELMAHLCGVDLAEPAFPENAIRQTSVARCNAVVAHHRFAGLPVFSLFCDISYAAYFADAISDALAHL